MQLDIPAFDENETLTDRVDVGRRVQAAPSTHPVHVLPQEILDYIVSLVEDPETLLACSLSSRTLLRMATNMTLRHLYVQRDTFEDILRELSSSPLKAYAVRRITLYNPKANPAHTVVPLNEAAALLPYLTNVNHFSVLSQFFDNSASPTVPLQGCAVSRIVTRLTLTFTLFQSPVHVLALINAFPNLQTLAMRTVFWRDAPLWSELDTMDPPFNKPSLRALDVRSTNFDIARLLSCDEDIRRLEVLGLEAPMESYHCTWWKEDVVSENLHHLTFYIYDFYSQDNLPPLPATPNLKSLAFSITLFRSEHARPTVHGSFASPFLRAVKANDLEELIFEFERASLSGIADIASLEWFSSLCLDKFAKMSRVIYSFKDAALMDAEAEITALILHAHKAWHKSANDVVEVIVRFGR